MTYYFPAQKANGSLPIKVILGQWPPILQPPWEGLCASPNSGMPLSQNITLLTIRSQGTFLTSGDAVPTEFQSARLGVTRVLKGCSKSSPLGLRD